MLSTFLLLSSLFFSVADAKTKHAQAETPVRATLGDGQVLMGEVSTKILLLKSSVGLVEIPLEDVGEVVPASGSNLGESEGRVDVWLRNGSELRGTWAEPELAMHINVGGQSVPINLPMNDLLRFQLQGGTHWPAGPVYRMQTTQGDDFLVDPSRTHLVVVNELGTFEPSLAECQYVAPVGDPKGLWRIQLQTGTVLLGHLQDNQVTVALPLGPEELSVPLDQFVSLRLERWAPTGQRVATSVIPETDQAYPMTPPAYMPPEMGYAANAEAVVVESSRHRPAARLDAAPAPVIDASVGEEAWFDSSDLAASKAAQE